MLVISNKTVQNGSPEARQILSLATERDLPDKWLATAYLKSIMDAKSAHHYKDTTTLKLQLSLISNVRRASAEVFEKIDCDPSNVKLNSTHWKRFEQKSRDGKISVTFECKSNNYAAAVLSTMLDRKNNILECEMMSDLVLLYALLRVAGENHTKVNAWLKERLSPAKERLRLPLINDGLLAQQEVLNYSIKGPYADLYEGDRVFRPGDRVAFTLGKDKDWELGFYSYGVENGVCVNWLSESGGANYKEPIFVGPGIFYEYNTTDGGREGQPKMLTEAGMKEQIYRDVAFRIPMQDRLESLCTLTGEPKTPEEQAAYEKCLYKAKRTANMFADKLKLRPRIEAVLKTHVLDLPRNYDHTKYEYNVLPFLKETVQRLCVFGGRPNSDLQGKS